MTLWPSQDSRSTRKSPYLLARQSVRTRSERIRLVHIINDVSIGGAEMMLYKLLSETDRERFEPIVVALRNRGELHRRIEALNVPVYNVAMRLPLRRPTSSCRLIRLIRRLNPDLIQGCIYNVDPAAPV